MHNISIFLYIEREREIDVDMCDSNIFVEFCGAAKLGSSD